jgi:hypothetical protein
MGVSNLTVEKKTHTDSQKQASTRTLRVRLEALMCVQLGSVVGALSLRELREAVHYRQWISRSITVDRLDQLMDSVKEINRLYGGGAVPSLLGTFPARRG